MTAHPIHKPYIYIKHFNFLHRCDIKYIRSLWSNSISFGLTLLLGRSTNVLTSPLVSLPANEWLQRCCVEWWLCNPQITFNIPSWLFTNVCPFKKNRQPHIFVHLVSSSFPNHYYPSMHQHFFGGMRQFFARKLICGLLLVTFIYDLLTIITSLFLSNIMCPLN